MMNNSVRRVVFRTTSSIGYLSPKLHVQKFETLSVSSYNWKNDFSRKDTYFNRQIRCMGSSPSSDGSEGKRRLDVAIVGAPNAGKSQLLNAMMGTTVAAVSRKRHTTRSGILAALTHKNIQLVFVDTPGYLRLDDKTNKGGGKKHILQSLMSSSMKEMELADYTLIVIDAAKKITDELKEALPILMMHAAASSGRMEDQHKEKAVINEPVREKFAIVLNKVDLVKPKKKLLEIATELGMMGDSCVEHIYFTQKQNHEQKLTNKIGSKQSFNNLMDGNKDENTQKYHPLDDEEDSNILNSLYPPVFFVSALRNDGVDDIVNHMMKYSTPCSEWALPPKTLTDMTDAERIEEIIREKLYRCLHREVPHQVEQVNRVFVKTPSSTSDTKHYQFVRIDQDLVVRTKSHARLVMGRGGMTLKRIKETSNHDLNKLFGCPVQLHLHVKLKKSNQPRGNEVDANRIGITQRSL